MQPAAPALLCCCCDVVVVIKLVWLNRREDEEGGQEGGREEEGGKDKRVGRRRASENYDVMEMHCLNTISRATANDLFYMSFAERAIDCTSTIANNVALFEHKRHLFHGFAQFLSHFLCL